MKRLAVILLLSLSFFSIYAQQWHTTLDVRRPSQKNFPSGIDNLLIVNNTMRQPDDFGHALILFDSQQPNAHIDLSTAPTNALFAATELFDYSNLFSSVGLIAQSQAAGTFFSSNSITKPQADFLCREYGADAVLSFDRLVIYDRLEEFVGEDYNYYAYLEVFAVTAWTLISANGQITSITHADTLYWEGSSYDSNLALQQLPDRSTALIDVAEYTGEQFAKQYISQWETVDRYMYENVDTLVAAGMQHFTYRRWQQAINSWQQAYNLALKNNNGNRKNRDYETAAYSAADIAVASEIMGNLSAATTWTERAIDSFSKMKSADAAQQQVNLTCYLNELRLREKEEKVLSAKNM